MIKAGTEILETLAKFLTGADDEMAKGRVRPTKRET